MLARRGSKRIGDLGALSHADVQHGDPQGPGVILSLSEGERTPITVRLPEEREVPDPGKQFAKQFDPLADEIGVLAGETCDIAPGPRQGLGKTSADVVRPR